MVSNNLLHVLIVDDEKLNIELAAVYLKEEGYKISYTTDALKAIGLVEEKKVDLILLDINMPEIDGFSVAKALKKCSNTKDIPIIFLTAQTDIDYITKAFEVGGVDYITKPFNARELKVRVKTHLQNILYLKEIKEKQHKLAQLSITDPLTKLHNLLYFDTQIKLHLKNKNKFWFIYLKINRFDTINNIFGFSKANKILRLFSKELLDAMPKSAITARLHGVGFGVLSHDYKIEYMQKLYKNLKSILEKKENSLGIKDYEIVFCRVNKETSIEILYKQIQSTLQDLEERGTQYAFIKSSQFEK